MNQTLKNKKTGKTSLPEHFTPKPATTDIFPMFAPGTSANISEHFEHFTTRISWQTSTKTATAAHYSHPDKMFAQCSPTDKHGPIYPYHPE